MASGHRSKYPDIAGKLEADIRRMRSDGIKKLPSEEKLCSEFNCSRQTIRSALSLLEKKGLIVKRKGSGSYIAGTGGDDPGRTVVLITEDEDKYIYPALISQMKYLLKNKKYELECRSTYGSLRAEGEILSDLTEDPPSAVVIEPISSIIPNPNAPLITKLTDMGVPVIFLFAEYPVSSANGDRPPVVREDDRDGAVMLVRHLKKQGHRKIAGIFCIDDPRGLRRYRGFMETCSELRLPFDENSCYIFTTYDQRRLVSGDRSFLRRFIDGYLRDNTAVVCQNDIIAYHLIRMLEQKDLHVPGNVSVVSFDNSYYTTLDGADITSLGHEDKALGNAVVNAVMSAVAGRTVLVPDIAWKLNVRASG